MKNQQAIQLKRDQQIVVGIDEEMPPTMDIHLGGESFTPESLADLVQRRVEAADDLFTARARLQVAVKNYAVLDRRVKPIVVELRTLVLALFGAKSPRVARFGFAPNKERRKLSVQEKVARAAKAKATRIARGTLGRRQRAAMAR